MSLEHTHTKKQLMVGTIDHSGGYFFFEGGSYGFSLSLEENIICTLAMFWFNKASSQIFSSSSLIDLTGGLNIGEGSSSLLVSQSKRSSFISIGVIEQLEGIGEIGVLAAVGIGTISPDDEGRGLEEDDEGCWSKESTNIGNTLLAVVLTEFLLFDIVLPTPLFFFVEITFFFLTLGGITVWVVGGKVRLSQIWQS